MGPDEGSTPMASVPAVDEEGLHPDPASTSKTLPILKARATSITDALTARLAPIAAIRFVPSSTYLHKYYVV